MYTCIFKLSHTGYSSAHLKRRINIGKHICLQLFFRFDGILRGNIFYLNVYHPQGPQFMKVLL